MLSAILLGPLCGLLLGGRFKIFATIPVILFAALLAGAFAVSGATPLGPAALIFLVFTLGLQAGYVVMLLAGPRLNRDRVGSFQA